MHRTKILYVEDEELIRRNHCEYIKNNFLVEVYEASNGYEGLEAYKKYHPDIIITDVTMPLMCGLEMIEKIRAEDTKTKIIIFSAHSDKEKLFRAMKLHLEDYKIKPIKRGILFEVVNEALKQLENTKMLYLTKEYYFDMDKEELYHNEVLIHLTKNEKKLFCYMLNNQNKTVDSFELFNAVWSYEKDYSQESIRSLIKKLRKKLPLNSIENIYGGGYKLHTTDTNL